ncbi:Mut7-C RNAse domain-containing protein [Thermogladius sp. 4427co]|uniref:Mut7-C RNAse domain-containing protein n=1 Tax=Thermogladius sp. 4427co TaxID=3450718 RepID=UPI003F7ABFB3
MNTEQRFIVDNMLGSVARWLRLLGYDTRYDRRLEDWRILRIAKEEDRVIVTRDRGLHRRALKNGLRSIYIENVEDISAILAYLAVVAGIRLSVELDKTRCPLCNGELMKVGKELVKGKVPERVYKLYNDFWVCSRCGNVYWVGSHWRKIEEILAKAREKYEELIRIYRVRVST